MGKIAILGSGALGTALAKILYDSNKKDIIIFGIDQDELKDLANGHNTKYFNDVSLPKFKTTNSLAEAVKGAKYIIIAVPSFAVEGILNDVVKELDSEVLFISGSKGFFGNTSLSLHEGIAKTIKDNNYARGIVSLIGPSHAEEMVLESPTIVAAVDFNESLCQEVQELFSNHYFRVYRQTDVKGAETGSAYKNVLAIASGIAKGLGYGINTIAGLLTRGMKEMRQFNKVMGGQDETLAGLTGFGDIIVTATSELSRNFSFGINIGKNKNHALDTTKTIEGKFALKHIKEIAKKENIELPIVNFLYKIIYEKEDPQNFVEQLWKRKLIKE